MNKPPALPEVVTMLIVKFAGVIINFLIKILTYLWKFIISFLKIIISGVGKVFTFFGKFIASGWKIVMSFFAKGGAAVKAPIVAKSIITTATGIAISTGQATVQSTKVATPVVKRAVTGIGKSATSATKRITSLSGKTIRRITNVEKNLINSAKNTKVSGKVVAKRNSTFNPKEQDALGRNNVQRMKQGLSPIGKDGKSVELHHLKQKNDGKIVELTNKEHKSNSKILHRYTNKSEINRQDFDKWKRQYWKERAKDFE